MAKTPVVGTIATGIQGLSRIPFGSLLLLASHRPKWRDVALTDAAIYGAFDAPVRILALSELAGLPEVRLQRRVPVLFDQWAAEAALKVCGSKPVDESDSVGLSALFDGKRLSAKEEEAATQAARESFEQDMAAWTEKYDRVMGEELSRFNKKAEAFMVTFQAIQSPTIDLVLEQIGLVPSGGIVVIDDLTAIRKTATQAGGLKLCGERARALKDAAVRHAILIVGGMPTTEVRDKRADQERALTLEDFGAYGSPEAYADAVITAVPFYDGRSQISADHILVSRY